MILCKLRFFSINISENQNVPTILFVEVLQNEIQQSLYKDFMGNFEKCAWA
jgi:hypothetical protein